MRQQGEAERELALHTAHLNWSVVRLRQTQWFQGQALSRALHGPVQAAVTSAALRLDAAVRDGQTTDELAGRIRADLAEVVDVLDVDPAQTPELEDSLARIQGTWEGLSEVRIDVTDAARDLLRADPVAAALVGDLVTEAVSNAVRHGEATVVEVRLDGSVSQETSLRDVVLTVQDNGTPATPGARAGLGTSLLEACTLEWGRSTTGSGNVLRAVIPGMAPAVA